MCGSKKKPKQPQVVQRDPNAEAAKAAEAAAKVANEEAANARIRKSKNNLLARGAAGVQGTASTGAGMAKGKMTLGG
jgi:hypothetical protein